MAIRLFTRLSLYGLLAASFIVGFPLPFLTTAAAQDPAAQEKKSGTTVWDGVYSAAQVQRGRAAYLEKCAACHKDDLSGYQAVLKGETFMRHWKQDTLESFYDNIKATMPRNAPASLSDQLYLDILTYVLQANDFPAGPQELTAAALSRIRIEEKSGKSELPTGALVDVVGCLVEGPANSWVLTLATEPIRSRNPNDSTPEQLKSSDLKPLGAAKFGLMDVLQFQPDSMKGNKVEAKGFLILNPPENRINLTAVQMTGSKCPQ